MGNLFINSIIIQFFLNICPNVFTLRSIQVSYYSPRQMRSMIQRSPPKDQPDNYYQTKSIPSKPRMRGKMSFISNCIGRKIIDTCPCGLLNAHPAKRASKLVLDIHIAPEAPKLPVRALPGTEAENKCEPRLDITPADR